MRFRKKCILCICVIFAAALFLGACVPACYTKEQEEAIIDKARPLIESFLDDNIPNAKTDDFNMIEGDLDYDSMDGASIGTDFARWATSVVKSTFTVKGDDREYVIYADTESGDIYTDYWAGNVKKAMAEVMEEAFTAAGEKSVIVAVPKMTVSSVIYSHDMPSSENGTINSIAKIRDAVKADINERNAREYIESNLKSEDGNVTAEIDVYTADSEIEEDVATAVIDEYPGIGYVVAQLLEESAVADEKNTGTLPLSAELNIVNECYFNGALYYRYDYATTQKDGAILVAPSYYYEVRYEPSDEPDKDAERNVNSKALTSSLENYDGQLTASAYASQFSYLYFTDEFPTDGKIKLTYGPGKNKYGFKECGEGYYTIDHPYFDRVFKFMGQVSIE